MMKIINSKQIDFGLLTIILTALGLGVVMYFITAPFWDDGPPFPRFFVLNRLSWFPICEIVCLTSFATIFKLFQFPKLRSVTKLFLSAILATNISILLIFFGRDIYQSGNLSFERYSRNFPFILYLIAGINIVSLFNFLCSWVFSFIAEKIFNYQKLD